MKKYCPVTGETRCRCAGEKKMIGPEKVDLKAALRKLFTDHAIFTANTIHAVVDGTKDVDEVVKRILQNQVDIGNQLKPIIGEEKGKRATMLHLQHIELASEVIKAAKKALGESQSQNKKGDKVALADFQKKLFANSVKVAEFLTSLNPEKLPYSATKMMFDMHNQFVIDMTVARLQQEFAKEIRLFDAYYNELLEMSDSIFNAL